MAKLARKILENEKGIALLMVSTAIVLLTIIMVNFSFDSNINKIKASNIEDKTKAKLVAESGLQFAMIRLILYKEAFNFLQSNESARDMAPQEMINSLWNFPFAYPIPVQKNMNQIQKQAIAQFEESSILDGNMQLTIENISQGFNINMLKLSAVELSDPNYEEKTDEQLEYSIENQLARSLKDSIMRRSETDEDFANQYFGIDTQILINTLKYYLSDQDVLNDAAQAEAEFNQLNHRAKHAPMSAIDEMYTLPGWDDELVDLIKKEFSPYGAVMIDLNKVTDKMLRIIFPNIDEQEILNFFEFKNDPMNFVYFNTTEDFKAYWVQRANMLSQQEIDDIFANFDAQGIKFGPAPSLFKIISSGQKGRATYTITAIVSIPAKPTVKPSAQGSTGADGMDGTDSMDGTNDQTGTDGQTNATGVDGTAEQSTQLLAPRIIEITIN